MLNVSSTKKFDFDDLLIVPAEKTKINSRYNDIVLSKKLPLMTAPMDTVVNMKNAKIFDDNNINVIIPRTEIKDWNYYLMYINEINENNYFISLGLDMFEELSNQLKRQSSKVIYNPYIQLFLPKPKRILLDIANGHIEKILYVCKKIKEVDKSIEIMIGSIANPKTYEFYAKSGFVDYVRCGIGAGNGCLTTKNASVGYPMASLIYECKQIKNKLEKNDNIKNLPAIVADGGMKNYSDIIKSLGLGADYVLLGSIFNKAIESAGDNYYKGFKIKPKLAKYLFKRRFKVQKYFRGMSTKEAQKAMGKTSLKTSEGVVRYRDVEYTLSGWVENFNHYLRNAMSYTNSKTIDEFIGNIEFCKITDNAYKRFDK